MLKFIVCILIVVVATIIGVIEIKNAGLMFAGVGIWAAFASLGDLGSKHDTR